MSESAMTPAGGMPCPRCRVDLVMTERMGVEIDYCPKCRGVWLDRGELDKIIERSEQFNAKPPEAPPAQAAPGPWQGAPQGQGQQPAQQAPQQPAPQQGGWDHGHGHGHGGGHGHDGYGRHGSFLGRLFG
jgi:hypothetical protein